MSGRTLYTDYAVGLRPLDQHPLRCNQLLRFCLIDAACVPVGNIAHYFEGRG